MSGDEQHGWVVHKDLQGGSSNINLRLRIVLSMPALEPEAARNSTCMNAALSGQSMYRADAEAHVVGAVVHIEVEHHDPLQTMPLLHTSQRWRPC